MTDESKRMSFSQMCAVLPEGFSWGDSLTPDVFQHIEAAILQAATRDSPDDTERLDFMLANTAFTVLCNRDGSIKQYQLMMQDEDENYHVLHNERRFYNTEREAIDAAIAASAPKGDGNDHHRS